MPTMPRTKIRARMVALHEKELMLILALREKFPYGRVTIIMHKVPQRIEAVKVIYPLGTNELSTSTEDTHLHNVADKL